MKLNDIINLVLTRSGQFFLEDPSDAGINKDRFYQLIEIALTKYEKWKPVTKEFTLVTTATSYVFSDTDLDPAPVWLSRVLPLSKSVFNYVPNWMPKDSNAHHPSLTMKMFDNFVWKYEKPILYTQSSGTFDVRAHYRYRRSLTKVGTALKDADFPDIEYKDHVFFDYLTGNFLVAVGKSRRSFTVQDMPLTTDADSMVAEGYQMITDADNSMADTNDWWLAIGE